MNAHRIASVWSRRNQRRAVCSCGYGTGWRSNELQARDELQRFHIKPLNKIA